MKWPHNHTTLAALYEDASIGLCRRDRNQDDVSAIIKTIRTGFLVSLFSMVMRLIISIMFLVIFSVAALFASSINSINKQQTFNSITIEDGLSHNSVRTICKDALGYIWIGTTNGLNKYDGYSVSSYINIDGDSTSLINNKVYALFLDSKGRFWIGTNVGLCYYDYNKNNFIRKDFVLDNEIINPLISSICANKKGIMWIGTNIGLFSMKVETLEIEYFPIFDYEKQGNLYIKKLLLESDSILNIGTHKNGFLRYNILNNTYRQYINVPGDETSISENTIESIYQDLEGTIWIGTNNNGVNILNRKTNSFTRILIDETNERSKRVRSIMQDQQGRYWFGTRNGLYTKNDMSKQKFIHYAHSDHIISKLTNNSIMDIYIDNSGIMWLGTFVGGLNYTNLNRKKIYHYMYGEDNSLFLNNKIVQCFAEDKKGNLWIGTENGGLNILNKKSGRYFYYTASDQENSLSTNNIKCMAFDDNNGLWVGTYQRGLDYLDVDNNKFYHFRYQENNVNSIPDNRVYSLLYDSNKNIWVGTGYGLCLINGKNKKIHRFDVNKDYIKRSKYESFPSQIVDALFEDKDGNIYVGMSSFGLFQFQKADSSFKKMDIPEYFSPLAVFKDTKNNLWMGTNVGLFLIEDFANSVFKKYFIDNGLPSNYVCGILEDEEENLWISTSAGLVKFYISVNNPHSTDFVLYDQSDGLQSNQFVKGAALKSEDGQLFFGGINGFNAFYPDSIEDNDNIPPVYINEFNIFNKPVPVGGPGTPLQNVIEQTNEIVLSWKQSVFSFGFIALNYIHPEKNLYAYKMDGFDQEWNYTNASRRLATYTNLNPGKYTFHVIASNNDGIWNEQGASLKIIITPPFWQTWWFRSTAIVIILILVFTTYQMKKKSIRQQRLELEHQVAERTVQLDFANKKLESVNKELEAFAYSVSHDLRAPLRSIDGFSKILLEEYQAKIDEQGQHYLQRVHTAVQRMAQLIDDILNLSRISRGELFIQRINLSSIAHKIANELRDSDPERKVKFIIQDEIIANGDENLFRIVLENLFGNAWKFTAKHPTAIIEFGMFQQDEKIIYFVRDDGAGFDMKYAQKLFRAFQRLHDSKEFQGTGIGLATVQRIIHRHNGRIWAEATPNEGAAFYFSLPYSDHKKIIDKKRSS